MLRPQEVAAVCGILGVAILGLLYAVLPDAPDPGRGCRQREDAGNLSAIREGAVAYLSRQLRTIVVFIAILTVALFGSAAL